MISSERRHPYFFLKQRTYLGEGDWKTILKKIKAPGRYIPDLSLQTVKDNGSIFVLGDSNYLKSAFDKFHKIALSSGYQLDLNPITPELDEFDGWALTEIKINN